jgi:hypothetical protein
MSNYAKGLPEKAYMVHPVDPFTVICIVSGVAGYYPVVEGVREEQAKNVALQLNTLAGIRPTEVQVKAMIAGSMFGWSCRGADPEHYGGKS